MLRRILNKSYNKWLAFLFRENFEQIPRRWGNEKIVFDFKLGKATTGYFTTADGLSYVADADCVEIKEDGLHLYSKPFFGEVYTNSWETPRPVDIKHGWFDFQEFVNSPRREGYSHIYGTWVAKIKFDPHSRIAIWLLRERHLDKTNWIDLEVKYINKDTVWFRDKEKVKLIEINYLVFPSGQVKSVNHEEGFIVFNYEPAENCKTIRVGRDNITPEVDLFELINGNMVQSVHSGYTPLTSKKYKKQAISSHVAPPTKNEYEVAVTVSSKGYKFYIDGILTTEVWEKSPKVPCYMICTTYPDTTEPTEAIVTELAYYYEL